MPDDDPLRYARCLMEASEVERVRAWGHLEDGDVEAFSEATRRQVSLLGAARWAAGDPGLGPVFLEKYRLELPERELPTRRVRRPGSSAPPPKSG
jgi:hypothetical protein